MDLFRSPFRVATAALLTAAWLPSGAQAAAPRVLDGVLRDRLLVKVAARAAATLDVAGRTTGIAALDALLAADHAVAVRPVFHRPPRGRADALAAARIGLDRWLRVDLGRDRADLPELLQQLRALPCVEVAEADRRVTPTVVPNDPDYAGSQWDLKSDRTDAEHAWDLVHDSSGLVVFVIDTGVETTHGDIDANLWTNPGEIAGDGIDNDLNGFIDDIHGWNFIADTNDVEDTWPHGMHVNGIIGAEGDNATKVAGINWSTRLAQGKIFDQGQGTWEAAAAATTYAADNGARVTNNSWGDTAAGPQVYVDAMNYADALDVLQVAAAGNQGDTNLFWPAAYAPILSVASTNSSDNRSSFSSHGTWIDMAAPGESIWNLWINNGTASLSGTSMASPHVCGAGALLRTLNPQLSNVEARVTLRLMSDDLGSAGYDGDFGFGRLDIKKALDAAASVHLSTRDVNRPGNVTVSLQQAGEANMVYVLLASVAGSVPGMPLSGFDPADARTFPLQYDALAQFCLLVQPNPLLAGSIGTLDASGKATATFHVPGGSLLRDKIVSLAFATVDPAHPSHVRFLSAPTSFRVH